MSVNDIAKVYASSIFDSAKEKNILGDAEEEVKFLAEIYEEDASYRQYLLSPRFSKDMKKSTVKKIFSGRLSDNSVNLLCLLIENDRQSAIRDIYSALIETLDEFNNRMRVTIVSSVKLEKSTIDNISDEMKKKYKKDIIINEEINESILGGIIIKIGDTVIDGSLSKDIKKIRTSLLNSKVRSDLAYED